MKTNPSYIEKLDGMLLLLKEHYNTTPFAHLEDELNNKFNWDISPKEKMMILGKLNRDGYIENVGQQGIRISLDGHIFIEGGGYATKALKDANDALLIQMEVDRRRTLDTLLATNSTRLNALTKWLVIGTLAVLLWQVFLYFYPVHKDYPYFFWEKMPISKNK
jgi:hypothetical protein